MRRREGHRPPAVLEDRHSQEGNPERTGPAKPTRDGSRGRRRVPLAVPFSQEENTRRNQRERHCPQEPRRLGQKPARVPSLAQVGKQAGSPDSGCTRWFWVLDQSARTVTSESARDL